LPRAGRPICLARRSLGLARPLRPAEYVAALAGMVWLIAACWPARGVHDGALAYIGPGAGIALFGSFLTVFIALFSAFLAILAWPIRAVWRLIRGRRAYKNAAVRRAVVLGLDGLEPTLTERFMDEGLLPNMSRLRSLGSYCRLGTTWPPLSPVAWSCFSTGANPGKHNIFDFITRNPADYRPAISSVRLREPRRTLRLGPYVIPLSKPEITALRKSKPFWTVLGEAGVFSAILRVPITFPPDKFNGVQLAAMCVPDLRGTQGMFTHYTETGAAGATMDGDVGGDRIIVQRNSRAVESFVRGPANTLRADRTELRLPFRVTPGKNGAAVLHIADQRVPLPLNRHTGWVRLAFRAAPGVKVHGICRFLLKSYRPFFDMYCTPLQIDPRKPVMPLSHPATYATYLACQHGPFATLGLAEDTWSLSERVLTEDQFLEQVYDIHAERERMFFDTLRCVRQGLVACVFDASDRVQHMFWRYADDRHPALKAEERTGHLDALRQMYQKMDDLVGRALAQMGPLDALFVMSDHGFKTFRRGIDLNAWLLANGHLKLKNGATTTERSYLADVDWSQTRAYAFGLAGIYINRQGREAQGIVAPGEEAQRLVAEIKAKLTGLPDPDTGAPGIHEVVSAREVYRGPYIDNAPDLIVGYSVGYRVAWDAAIGKCGPTVFGDNTKAWSGDHCVHPQLVPGILFSNLKLNTSDPNIIDLGPSILDLFGVKRPAYMDGKSLVQIMEHEA